MTKLNTKGQRMYKDKDGNEIPSSFIFKIDRQKHSAAIKYFKKAKKLSQQLQKFKEELYSECDKLHEQALEENRITVRKNAKGGYSVMTIDKAIKIEVSVSETISFDDNIDMAHTLIKDYLQDLTTESKPELKVIISETFRTKRGKLETSKVLGLLKWQITAPKWLKAMELVKKSIQVNDTRRYVRIWERDTEGKYNMVKLDFASI